MTRVEFIRQHAEQLAYLMSQGSISLQSRSEVYNEDEPFSDPKTDRLNDEVSQLTIQQSSVNSTLLELMEDNGFALVGIQAVTSVRGTLMATFDLTNSENLL